jgi:hypothetical protein
MLAANRRAMNQPDRPGTILSAATRGPFSSDRLHHFLESYDPSSLAKDELLDDRFILAAEAPYGVYFAPFGSLPDNAARIVFVGLTPGLTQVRLCAELHRSTDAATRNDPVAFSRLFRAHVAFAGSMRVNLCKMLDDLGLHTLLGVAHPRELFERSDSVIATTSALVYPVFKRPENTNFGGSANLASRPLFREMLTVLLAPRLDGAPDALIVPLGNSAASGVQYLVDQGALNGERVLFGLPHPSGANGHRTTHFAQRRDTLQRGLRAWSMRLPNALARRPATCCG